MKKCTKCHIDKPLSDYHLNKPSKDGRLAICKNCVRSRNTILYNLVNGSKRRAFLKGLEHNITSKDILELLDNQQYKCALSDIPINIDVNNCDNDRYLPSNRASIDRIDNSKGYTRDNIQMVAFSVNMQRGHMSIEEFIIMCKSVANKYT